VLPFAARSALVALVSFEIHTHIDTHTLRRSRVCVCMCGHTLRCFLVDGIALVSPSLAFPPSLALKCDQKVADLRR